MSSNNPKYLPQQTLGALIGSGKERHCYAHPDNPLLCIKVTRPGVVGRRQNELDWTYFRYLQKRGINSPHVPKCHSWVITEYGRGLVVDRICRTDLTPAPTLHEAVASGEISKEQALTLTDLGFSSMIANNIVVVDYHPDHMLVSGDSAGQRHLVVVDGLGSRHLGPRYWLRTRIPAYGRKKTRAVWEQIKTLLVKT